MLGGHILEGNHIQQMDSTARGDRWVAVFEEHVQGPLQISLANKLASRQWVSQWMGAWGC